MQNIRLIATAMVFAVMAIFWPLGSSTALALPRSGVPAANMLDQMTGTNSLKTDVRARRYYPRYRHAGRGYRNYGYRNHGYRNYGYRNYGYRGRYYGHYGRRYLGPRYAYRYSGYSYNYSYGDYYYDGGGSDAHVEWCLNRYRSYNPRTDTYTGYDGHQHYCNSSY